MSGGLGLDDPHDGLRRSAERLATRYEGIVNAETVERVVFESYTAVMRTANVSAQVPNLAHRFAQDRLLAGDRVHVRSPGSEPGTTIFR